MADIIRQASAASMTPASNGLLTVMLGYETLIPSVASNESGFSIFGFFDLASWPLRGPGK
jgi:hypothetical protein